jgi:hypothetical protein
MPTWALIALLFLTDMSPTRGADMKALLDCAANDRLFDTHFTRFGPLASKGVLRDGKGIHFKLPRSKESGHTGLYSYVVLAGDFEISARFHWAGVPVPKTGYGASAGIVVDTSGAGGSLSLARANFPKVGGGFAVTRGIPGAKETRYESFHEPTRATSGRLVIRRERSEIICSVAEGDQELRELRREPFTDATIRQVRIYADPGGGDGELDARIYDVRLVAEEITGNVPERDKSRGYGWWPTLIGSALVGLAYVAWRKRQK